VYAVATLVVAVGVLLKYRWFVLDLVGVMMCHWAQRHGQDAELDIQHGRHRFHFRTKR
jgi:hypothetical protein